MMSAYRLRSWSACGAIVALLLIAGPLAHAALRRTNWHLEGYLGQAPAGSKVAAHIVLQYDGKDYEFDLTKAASTNPQVPGSQFVGDLKSHHNRLSLRGPAASMDTLRTAAPGQKLLISGYYRRGSGEMQETMVAGPAPTSR
jgi:hypothetical protein